MTVSNPARLSPGFQSLFPPGIIAAELRAGAAVELLLPAEAACLGRSVPARALEFAGGRLCARRALAELGVVGFALAAAPDRRPVWPDGIVGSITHTTGLCAAAVARGSRFQGLGIDSEIVGRATTQLWPKICVPGERAWLESLPPAQRAAAATLLFAAKEAFYKCQSPLTGEWLGFKDLQVEVADFGSAAGADSIGTFRVMPTRHIALAARWPMPVAGRYRFHGEFVSAGVALETQVNMPGRPGTPSATSTTGS